LEKFDFFPGYTPTTSERSRLIRFWKPLNKIFPDINSKKVISNEIIISSYYASKYHQHELRKNLEIFENANLFLDSGGFQLINEEKFNPNIETAENILDYQIKMNCNIGAILDYPVDIETITLPEKIRRMKINLELIKAIAKRYPEERKNKMLLYGVIHGWDISSIKNFTVKLKTISQLDGFAYGTPKPKSFSEMSTKKYLLKLSQNIWQIKSEITNKPLHVFGISNFPAVFILAYLGIESFDSYSFLHAAKYREYFLPWGMRSTISRGQNKKKLNYLSCSCPICEYAENVDKMKKDGMKEGALVALHNLIVQKNIVNIIKSAFEENWINELIKDAMKIYPEITEAILWINKRKGI